MDAMVDIRCKKRTALLFFLSLPLLFSHILLGFFFVPHPPSPSPPTPPTPPPRLAQSKVRIRKRKSKSQDRVTGVSDGNVDGGASFPSSSSSSSFLRRRRSPATDDDEGFESANANANANGAPARAAGAGADVDKAEEQDGADRREDKDEKKQAPVNKEMTVSPVCRGGWGRGWDYQIIW